MKNLSLVLLISLMFIVLFSCKTLKHSKTTIGGMEVNQLFDSITANELNFKTLSSKFAVKYKANKSSMGLKGNLKIIKDSVIWISLSPGFGIEAARLICTKDSIFLIERLKKTITRGGYGFLNKMWHVVVDYKSLESILTNRFFIYPKVENTKSAFLNEFKFSDDEKAIILEKTNSNLIENLIKIAKKSFTVSNYSISDIKNKRNLKINYSLGDFERVKHFPSDINVLSTADGQLVNANLHYKRINVNKPVSISYNFPTSYKSVIK